MKIVPKLDAGPVLIQSKLSINNETNYEELSEKMSALGSKLIIEAFELIKNNKANFIPQDENKVSYAKKIEKSESKINWNENAKDILAKIKAFYPYPGCWFKLNNSRIKVIKALEVEKTGNAGSILDEKMTIACKNNALQILELQKEGKKLMSASDYLKGNQIKIGQTLN